MSGRAGAGRSQRPSEGSGRVLSGRFTVHMMSDVHAISGALDKEQGLRGANSEERQVGLKAGFIPAVPQPCHLPRASQRGRGEGRVPRRGTSVPPANGQTQGSARWGLRPDLFRPSPNRATFQAPPSVAEERGGSAAGDICPPANEQTQGSARWGLRPDVFRPSPNRATF